MGTKDPWSRTDRLEDRTLDAMVARLEARGKHPPFVGMLNQYLDAMGIEDKAVVLDLGCGTGVAARVIAARAAFSGKVLGIDLSPQLAEAAARLADAEGLGARVEFRAGDSRSLELEDNCFDAVVAHTLVSHVENPLRVVREAARLLRPGGMVGIFDGDFASRTFAQADPEQTRRDDERINHSVNSSPYAMRYMPRYLKEAGLELTAFFPNVIAGAGQADSCWSSSIEVNRRLLPETGVMTKAEADTWADAILRSSEEGVFFGANNFYSYVARKP